MFIPLQPHFLALQGLSKLFETTALVKRRLNRRLSVSGVVLCLYETGTRLAQDITDDLFNFLSHSDPVSPWANAKIFDSRIRRNIKLAEAPSFGKPIFEYEPKCAGAIDYNNLSSEVIEQEAALTGDSSKIGESPTTTPSQVSPASTPDMPEQSDLSFPGNDADGDRVSEAA